LKKLFAAMLIFLCISSIHVSATKQDWARLPDGDVTFNGQVISYADNTYRQYPILYYKEIIYFPMTYYDCRFLGISTKWDNETKTLHINKENITCAYRDYNWEYVNKKVNIVNICDFNIVVNGKEIEHAKEPYPCLTFRGVTYFPLTWRFAVEKFGWDYSYDHENGLVINSNNYICENLALPETSDTNLISIAMDDEYYYYTGNNCGLYRAKIDNISDYELLYTPDSYAYGDMANVDFYELDGHMYFTNRVYRGDTHNYRINKDGSVFEAETGNYSKGQMGYNESRMVIEGIPYKNYSAVGRTRHSYFENNEWIEIELDGVYLRHYLGSLGANIYIEGYASTEIPQNRGDIYRFNIKDKSINKIITDIEFDKAFKAMWLHLDESNMVEMLFFESDNNLMRYTPHNDNLIKILELTDNCRVDIISDGNPLFFAMKYLDKNLLEVYEMDAYDPENHTGKIRFRCSDGYASSIEDKILVTVATPEANIRTAVITSYNQEMPFQTSDIIHRYCINGDTLYYSIYNDNAPNGFYKVNLTQHKR